MTQDKSIRRIKSGFFDRGLSLTKLAIQSGAKFAHGSLKGALSDPLNKELHLKAMMTGQAQLLVRELGQLKGSLMKVGQMLALYGEHFLPEEVVSSLKTLNDQSPPVQWSEIEKILRKRLHQDILDELEIDTQALAAASMGQVHKARIKASGEWICLKIQYPGVDTAIDSDIKALRSLLSMFKFIPTHSEGYEELFQEIREMLMRELNYEQELRFTDLAALRLAADQKFIVPRVFPRYSCHHLLATSFEEGISLDSAEVAALSSERRSRLGIAFARLFLLELFHFKMMQTDPHFGNYRVRLKENGDDQLILLDWGAVQEFKDHFLEHYKNMILGAIHADSERVIQSGIGIGFLREDDHEKLKKCFVELAYIAIEPWLPPRDPRVPSHLVDSKGCYMWARSDLPSRVATMATKYALSFKMRPPPRDILFLDRKIGGVFIVLKILDARFQGHKLLEEELLQHWGERFPREIRWPTEQL